MPRDVESELSYLEKRVLLTLKDVPRASPEEVRDHVRRHIAAFKPGGGYVFNNVHNIQADVPPENILAMYDAAFEFGRY